MGELAAVFKIPSKQCSRDVYKVLPDEGAIMLKHMKFYFHNEAFQCQVLLYDKRLQDVELKQANLDTNLNDRIFGFLPLDNYIINCSKIRLGLEFYPDSENETEGNVHTVELVFEKIEGGDFKEESLPFDQCGIDKPITV